MADPIIGLAEARLIDMYIDLSVQLEKGTGTRPMLWLLIKARKRAAEAIYAICKIDPTKADDIRQLQNEVNLFADMIEDAKEMLVRGKEADRELDEGDRNALAEFLTTDEALEMGVNQTED